MKRESPSLPHPASQTVIIAWLVRVAEAVGYYTLLLALDFVAALAHEIARLFSLGRLNFDMTDLCDYFVFVQLFMSIKSCSTKNRSLRTKYQVEECLAWQGKWKFGTQAPFHKEAGESSNRSRGRSRTFNFSQRLHDFYARNNAVIVLTLDFFHMTHLSNTNAAITIRITEMAGIAQTQDSSSMTELPFPPLTKSHVIHCSYHSWYPRFDRCLCLRLR